jgi:hypothetical protein
MPDAPDAREEDIFAGDRRLSRPDASLPDWEVPDTAYRPVPIVWFTAALLVQCIVLALLMALLQGLPGAMSLAATALASGAIWQWTWQRGMAQAGAGWKVATAAMLAFFFALFALAHLPRL